LIIVESPGTDTRFPFLVRDSNRNEVLKQILKSTIPT